MIASRSTSLGWSLAGADLLLFKCSNSSAVYWYELHGFDGHAILQIFSEWRHAL